MASKVNDNRLPYVLRPKEPKPDKPKYKGMKRNKPIPRESKKRATLRAIVNPGRKGFLLLHPVCMLCGKRKSEDVHEIARGNAREGCLSYPELQLAVCRTPCHDDLDDLKLWPPERQMFARMMYDLKAELLTLNELRGRAETAITIRDVVQYLEMED